MTILVVQSRLDSSRLPEKALLPLLDGPVLAAVLRSMKNVPADRYILATDAASERKLAPVAEQCGFECMTGPKEDVLERFCIVAEKTGADNIIRATGDNPFLFYEAARALAEEFAVRGCDYFTWMGLPHGSGVEMFSASALLKARETTRSPYDHEHVGPALYNHPGRFNCVREEAPAQWRAPQRVPQRVPQYRTTIDTAEDYDAARRLVSVMTQEDFRLPGDDVREPAHVCTSFPFPASHILEACARREHRVLCVPSAVKGRGTGHFRRCVSLAAALGSDLYIPPDATLERIDDMTGCLDDIQIKRDTGPKGHYSLIVADKFALGEDEARRLASLAPLAAIDDGGPVSEYADYLLDIIPARSRSRKANRDDPSFIPLPENRKSARPATLKSTLVVIGGEDPAGLTHSAAGILAELGYEVTAVIPAGTDFADMPKNVKCVPPISGLRERLAEWDLIVTHYGFTAFEASAAGCAVLLLGTTELHTALSRNMGFAVVPASEMSLNAVSEALSHRDALFSGAELFEGRGTRLSSFIMELAAGRRIPCPVCGTPEDGIPDEVTARFPDRTIRRCRRCGMQYLGWSLAPAKKYEKEYFFEEYSRQYGKTYLEDFHAIRKMGRERLRIMQRFRRRIAPISPSGNLSPLPRAKPSILDIGCAYGPFLSAAQDAGWEPFGIDISADAVHYVTDTLHFSAAVATFPDFDPASVFGQDSFDAVTLWYVIEHFSDLDAVLRKVASIVKPGGLLAFSTPSAAGVSGRYSSESFLRNSPSDHFTLWEPAKTAKILKRYGFAAAGFRSTGHHPERFPVPGLLKGFSATAFARGWLGMTSKVLRLGDTFEAYFIRL